ncbi:MAG TPA: hypothetical protein VGS79_06380 [Puia sp.]|nr:hypothetical protein [Puia sp.]
MEPTQPGIFHIHIDAVHLPARLHEFARRTLGFAATDFEGHPEGYDHFEPACHLTLKLSTKEQFRSAWDLLLAEAQANADFVGYLEGEYIPTDEYLPFQPYKDLPVPFKVTRRRLDPCREEDFRQTEFHLTMEKNRSSAELIGKLLDSGLYGAYITKPDGEFLVLTMQGSVKDIRPLQIAVRQFVCDSGGAYRCTLKEERAIAHYLQAVTQVDLPEIAAHIEYY